MTIGVMDSGIGGITTLGAMMELCGGNYIYLRDSKGPYGYKSDEFVLSRTQKACELLKSMGAEIIVLACNTATNVAIERLRQTDPSFTYIGVEPAVKPALTACKKVAVALTPAAARQKKFNTLISKERDRIKIIALPYLASQIEDTFFDLRLNECATELYIRCAGCDGLVLGCTHYIFLKEQLKRLDGRLKIFDGNQGVARRLYEFTGKMKEPSVRFVVLD